MASFQSILKVGGKEYNILYSDLGLGQAVDSLGRPASAVYGGMITIELNTPANDATLYEWMVNPEKRMDGQIILRRLDSKATLKSIKFYTRDVGPCLLCGHGDPFRRAVRRFGGQRVEL